MSALTAVRWLALLTTVLLLAPGETGSAVSRERKPGDRPAAPAAEGKDDLNDLSLQVDALLLLHYFEFTPAQLKALTQVARNVAPKRGTREPAKASDKFRTALVDLRAALVKANDFDLIDKLKEALDEIRTQEDPDLDDDVEITDAARRTTPEVLRSLSVRQIAAYLDNIPEEVPEPLEKMLSALDKAGELKDADWKELQEEVAEELGWLLGGLDKRKAKSVATRVEAWLKQVRGMTDQERSRKRPELEKTARQFVEQVSPTEVLHHIIEHALAELLSNPQLPTALAARLQQ